jgi:precorrin-6B methylase 2
MILAENAGMKAWFACFTVATVLFVTGGCATKSREYTSEDPAQSGTRVYMGRPIADVMSSEHGSVWLDRPGRQTEEIPTRIIRSLQLTPAEVVADIGAGTGYISFLLAREVPHGKVLAVDVQPVLLDTIRVRMNREGVDNITPILGSETSPNLPVDGVDLALIVSSYHEFSEPAVMLNHIYQSLHAGGRLVIVEYRAEDPTIPIPEDHRMSERQIRKEAESSGFRWRDTIATLPQQHIVVFEKPVSRP